MTLEEESRLSYYREMTRLSDTHDVWIVQHTESRKLFVRKRLSVYDLSVYRFLQMHPIRGIPSVYEAVEDEDQLIVIEEYISGRSLGEILRGGPLPEQETVRIFWQLCLIVRSLHTAPAPIIHRDIKPSNVMMSSDGVVKLIDLNAAKKVSEAGTRDTVLIGTEGYAAPEQYGFGVSTVQTDIYAMGILLNVMLTGGIPQQRMYSGKLSEVIRVCTKLSPEERYKDMDALMNAVNIACGGKKPQKHWIPWLLPGYRTLNPWKMILATIGYGFFFWMGFSMWVDGKSVFYNWMNRTFFILCFMSMFLITGNYMGVLDFLKVTKIRNRVARWIVIAVIDMVVFSLLILILQIIVGDQG